VHPEARDLLLRAADRQTERTGKRTTIEDVVSEAMAMWVYRELNMEPGDVAIDLILTSEEHNTLLRIIEQQKQYTGDTITLRGMLNEAIQSYTWREQSRLEANAERMSSEPPLRAVLSLD
jgi:hypothetical protein